MQDDGGWNPIEDKEPEEIATFILRGGRCLYTDTNGQIPNINQVFPLCVGDIVYCYKSRRWYEYQ